MVARCRPAESSPVAGVAGLRHGHRDGRGPQTAAWLLDPVRVVAAGKCPGQRGGAVTAVEANAGTAAASLAGSGRPSGTAQLDSLTGLRFIAAFTVFGFHVGVGGLVDQGRVGALQD